MLSHVGLGQKVPFQLLDLEAAGGGSLGSKHKMNFFGGRYCHSLSLTMLVNP